MSATRFEQVCISETNEIEVALSEQGRNLAAEYPHFLEEFRNLEVQFRDLSIAVEHLKVS